MQTNVITIDPEMAIAEVQKLLTEHGISGAPVVSRFGDLLGILSKADVLSALSEGNPSAKAADIMSTDVLAVQTFDCVVQVAALLQANRIQRVLVYEQTTLVGVVSTFDFLEVVKRFQPES